MGERTNGLVFMPWDDRTVIFPKRRPTMTKWEMIKDQLNRPIEDVDHLIEVINSYNDFGHTSNMIVLRNVIEVFSRSAKMFGDGGVLYTMQELALSMESKCKPISWLQTGKEGHVKLSQMKIAGILANAFFCTFSRKDKVEPSINFNRLFEVGRKTAQSHEKLMCIMNYFCKIHENEPKGKVYYYRRCMSKHDYPRWDKSTLPLTELYADEDGRIEDQDQHIQMDFAYKVIGGDVLGSGCAQEEIRFAISPELIAARLFCEAMADNEAIVIVGSERFSNYSGHGHSFQFDGIFDDNTEMDAKNRRLTQVVAVDAFSYHDPQDQYLEKFILRELRKLHTGLKPIPKVPDDFPLATGNWGCGILKGDPQLKSLLQILAASQTGRNVAYFTFGDRKFKEDLQFVHEQLRKKSVNVGELYCILENFKRDRNPRQTVFDFVLQSIHNRSSEDDHGERYSQRSKESEFKQARGGYSAGRNAFPDERGRGYERTKSSGYGANPRTTNRGSILTKNPGGGGGGYSAGRGRTSEETKVGRGGYGARGYGAGLGRTTSEPLSDEDQVGTTTSSSAGKQAGTGYGASLGRTTSKSPSQEEQLMGSTTSTSAERQVGTGYSAGLGRTKQLSEEGQAEGGYSKNTDERHHGAGYGFQPSISKGEGYSEKASNKTSFENQLEKGAGQPRSFSEEEQKGEGYGSSKRDENPSSEKQRESIKTAENNLMSFHEPMDVDVSSPTTSNIDDLSGLSGLSETNNIDTNIKKIGLDEQKLFQSVKSSQAARSIQTAAFSSKLPNDHGIDQKLPVGWNEEKIFNKGNSAMTNAKVFSGDGVEVREAHNEPKVEDDEVSDENNEADEGDNDTESDEGEVV